MISYLSSLSPFCFSIVIIIHYIKIKRKSFCFFLTFIFFFCIYSNFCIIFRYFYYKVLESKVFFPFDTRLLRLSDLLTLVSLYRIKDKLKKHYAVTVYPHRQWMRCISSCKDTKQVCIMPFLVSFMKLMGFVVWFQKVSQTIAGLCPYDKFFRT